VHGGSIASDDDASGGDACPMHNASAHAAQLAKATPGTSPKTPPNAPLEKGADKHDCCKSSGCQGHCGNVPLAFNVAAIRGARASASVQTIRATLFAVAPADTHFRPPIAS
jgi:hypothetical protein